MKLNNEIPNIRKIHNYSKIRKDGIEDKFKEQFTYIVNHDEALIDLAIKFYGKEEGVEILKNNNIKYKDLHRHEKLEKGSKIIVI